LAMFLLVIVFTVFIPIRYKIDIKS
jgi:hypothetical protein